jgi:hypothetical protein
MAPIAVPNVVGQTQADAGQKLKDAGLVVGTVTKAASATVPAGSVTVTNPAAGAVVNSGSAVSLEVSSGPAQVAVPPIVGLTRPAAEGMLRSAGLVVGAVKTQHSNSVPAGGISDTSPDVGTPVPAGSTVELEISNGPEPDWTQYIPTALWVALGLVMLVGIGYAIFQNGQSFLLRLADQPVARGLITFLIAITTVGIAIILAISTLVLAEGDAGDKRFDRGKQVLSTLIGVLGTIVGFYFGSAPDGSQHKPETEQASSAPKIITTSLTDGAATKPYLPTILQTANFTPPLKWSVAPPLPAELKLDAATGVISGTPSAPAPKAKYKFTAIDSSTPPFTSTAEVSLEIK